ncbi:ATP-dependent Clp protease proteolytic subunit 2, mitochondrial-like [Zingiber officinale]|uniref:Endopeptidase Clp n=1 Tax=Zingiber officinale TaxID=94328 RepID=A0A8J5KI78_ZINOF|nr:ATP-dependent Clp protease proteolytic subunit 2, mitochondrial-like [Zingiber officinale]KAG6484533.1 hypothetical protein ZIOFF_053052 [Zingiber officinale]
MLWCRLALSGSLLPSARLAGAHRSYSVIHRANKRIVFINGPISDDTSSDVIDRLHFLDSEDPSKPIHLYIHSDGGSVNAGLAIYDAMQDIRSRISTLCIGQACSIGSLLLAAGAPGERRAFPHSEIMIHQPSCEISGQVGVVAIRVKEILKVYDRLIMIYSRHTGQPIQRIEQCMERDMDMSPDEAKELGLVDEVIVLPLALRC